jgi:hypothetical protein
MKAQGSAISASFRIALGSFGPSIPTCDSGAGIEQV